MSRHKNIRGLNLEDELDDYDGEGFYDEEDDLEDAGCLRLYILVGRMLTIMQLTGLSPADKGNHFNNPPGPYSVNSPIWKF